jgi:phosphatidylinositol-3-phosphatase
MVSGGTQGISSDCGGCNVDAPNLVDQLEAAGISWKAYMEGLPAPCSDAHQAGAYAKKHDPFMYFASVRGDPGRCAKVVPFDRLDADLVAGRLPRLVFITPSLDHDMHGAGEGGDDPALVASADRWLERLYGKLAGSPAWREDTRLVVTWDEGHGGGGPTGCCGGLATGGRWPPSSPGPASGPPATAPPTATTPCSARSRPCSICRCWATPATRPPRPSPPSPDGTPGPCTSWHGALASSP